MNVEAESHIILRGRQLTWARVAWIAWAFVLFGVVIASWPLYFELLLTVCETCRMTPAYAQTLHSSGITTTQWAFFLFIPAIIVNLGWMGTGTVIFLLKHNDRRALLLSALMIVIGASFGSTIASVAEQFPDWEWVNNLIGLLAFPAFVCLIYLFPNATFKPRLLIWLLGLLFVLFIPIQFESLGFPIAYNFVITISFVISCLVVPVYRYRRVLTFAERQQMKWVLFGIVLAMIGIATTIVLVLIAPFPCDPSTPSLYCDAVQNIGYSVSPLLIPIFIGIAILHSRLWDINVVIRKTLVYAVLSGLLALVYFGMIVLLQSVFVSISGQQSPIAIVISTLVIAVLFAPLRRRIQDVIDRRFFRKKYDAQQVLAQFAQTARDETDMEALQAELLRVVQETMQPEGVSLWIKTDGKQIRGY
jgi:hypothetical protein